mgnify:CR=1 FL=1
MGGARAYNPAGGFYFKDFEQVGDTIYYWQKICKENVN